MKITPFLAATLIAAIVSPLAAQEAADIPPPIAEGDAMAAEVLPNPVEPKPGVPAPIGMPDEWVTTADYPPAAWRNGEAGYVEYELEVDSAGAVTGCRITASEATPALDLETCRLLRERARFLPAKDEEGKPFASVYYNGVLWQRREAEFGGGSFTIKVAFTLDERGNTRNCRILERSGDIPADMLRSFEREPCPGRNGVPARDAEGRPVARDIVLTVSVEGAPAAAPGN